MKKIMMMFVVGLLTQQITQAQGTLTYLSNLGQTSTGSGAVGSESKFTTVQTTWFVTGTNAAGYTLNSVQMEMLDATTSILGSSSGGFTVTLYSATIPPSPFINPPPELGESLGSLDGSTNPATGGIYTYTTASNITLLPG